MRPRRPSPAMIVALVALVIALGGTAVAASRYIITSTSQIKPTVLRELQAPRAATSAAVPKGPKAIVSRVSLAAPVLTETPSEGYPPSFPLTGGSWTQAAHQANGMFGQVTVRNPPQGACQEQEGGSRATVELLLDNVSVGTVLPRSGPPYVAERTYELAWSTAVSEFESDELWLPDPTSAISHTLSARGLDQCDDGSHFTVTAIHVDVLGFR